MAHDAVPVGHMLADTEGSVPETNATSDFQGIYGYVHIILVLFPEPGETNLLYYNQARNCCRLFEYERGIFFTAIMLHPQNTYPKNIGARLTSRSVPAAATALFCAIQVLRGSCGALGLDPQQTTVVTTHDAREASPRQLLLPFPSGGVVAAALPSVAESNGQRPHWCALAQRSL